MTSNLPKEIRRWVSLEDLDVKTRVRFKNLADEIERLDRKADKSVLGAALHEIRTLCDRVDTETYEPLQQTLVDSIYNVLDSIPVPTRGKVGPADG